MNPKHALVLSALIIVMTPLSAVAVPLATDEYKHGPREDELLMNFYADVESAYEALERGEIDAVWFDLTYAQYLDAVENENIQLAPVDDFGMYEVDINNNYTIPSYPGVRSPTHHPDFRKAMAHLLDKNHVVANCCKGFATRIDVPVAAPVDVDWINTSVVEEWGGVYYGNYPYPYDPWTAQSVLDAAGFVVGSTPNPTYDPDVPWSQEYLRTYPSDWDGKAGEDLDPLVAVIRKDDSRRLCMGNLLADQLELSGIPCDRIGNLVDPYGRVMGMFDYHLYTGGWGLGRFPTGQYGLYHHDSWYPWGPNYVTGVNKTGHPNYPDLDKVLEDIYYCEDLTSSQLASRKAQSLLVDKYCICLWAYSAKAYWAYRNLLGVTNMDGYGLDNDYTFMNMRTVDGGIPTVGIITAPYQQNVLMSSWFYDRQVLDRYYGASAGFSVAPYSLARDQPWVIQDWTTTTWFDPEDGKNKTVVTVWFRENVEWISPVTGAVYGNFTSHDFMFSEFLMAGHTKCWTHDDKEDIHHIKIVDDYCVEVFMESESYWLQYVGDYVVNKALWQDKFCMINTTTVVLDQDYVACEKLHLRPYITSVGPGQWKGQILQMVDCTLDGVTLIEDIDYEIVMLEDDRTYFHWLRNASAGQVLTVVYWTPDPGKPSPDGYWPGEFPWEQIAVGIGTHYLVDYVRGAGGHATLKANRNFWLETPVPDPQGVDPCNPLPGEVDWIWEWGPRDTDRPLGGPRCGNYKVDISDVVRCTAAYRSHGNKPGEIDPDWFAGADMAPPECYIDIGDVVTITDRYRRKFGGWTKVLTCP
jgi:hypothetical protein